MQTHEDSTVYVAELDFSGTENPPRYASSFIARKAFPRTTGIRMSGPTVNNHVSLKTMFGYNLIRETTYRSWSQVYRRLHPRQVRLAQHLQHHFRRKVQAQHLFQHQLNVRVRTSKHGATRRLTQPKTQNPTKMLTMNRYGATRHFRKYLDGCENRERILWMKESPSIETHLRVLFMNPL